MDAQRFDLLTKGLAIGKTRRSFLKGLAGGLLAAVAGGVGWDEAAAARCREPDRSCEKDAHCCSGICAKGANGRRVCACPKGTKSCDGACIPAGACCTRNDCPAPPDVCHRATCTGGTCGFEVTAGRRCDDGDRCTSGDVCQADGTCHGSPKDCSNLSDACNDAVCDPASGDCRRVPAREGASCPGDDLCFHTFTCRTGSCVGSDPVACTALDQCHDPGTCNPRTGVCSNPNAPDGTTCNDDNACTSGDTCQHGVCTGGAPVVCTNDNPCLTTSCDPAKGCSTSPKPRGVSCGDDNPCNGEEVCDGAGSCVAGTPVLCLASDPCHDIGVCDPTTGTCSSLPKDNGTSCSTGDLCTTGETCQAGVCTGGTATACSPSDTCHDAGKCDPTTGLCSNPDRGDGAGCDDGNACTETGACQAGVCTPGTDVVCQPLDDCHVAGVCDPLTGECSNPTAADFSPCAGSGDLCYLTYICYEGVCYGDEWVSCTAPDGCHSAYCDESTGECVVEQDDDGSRCSGPDNCKTYTCSDGICQEDGPRCESPEICDDGGCCIPNGSLPPDGTSCCSGKREIATGLCICLTLGLPCDSDSECCGALNPACCDGRCVDLESDPLHCGSCDNPVPGGGYCAEGTSRCFAITDTTICDNRCVDTNVELEHCGRCDHSCNIGTEVCSEGHCCPVGHVWGGSRCCPITTHEDNGICCAAGSHEDNGICCLNGLGLTNCGGTCVSTTFDVNNCGGCGVRVPSGGTCTLGVPTCPAGMTNCGGTCVSTTVDLNNCGSCGHSCNIGSEVCSQGHCCPVGSVWGGSRCCPITTHEDNGICCAAGFHNSNGVCCAAGLTNCGGACISTTVDLNNCGGCGVGVPIGGTCTFGNPVCPAGSWNDNGRCCFNTERNCGGCCSIFAKAVCPC